MGSAGDVDVDRTIGDLVRNGILPQMQQGEHAKWTDNRVFQLIRKCPKVMKSTLGKVLNFALAAIQFDGKDLHGQIEHESGMKVSIDEDGNTIFEIPAGSRVYFNQAESSTTDDNALVTRKFLTAFYNDLVTKYNTHLHPGVTVGAASTLVTTSTATPVSGSLPDTVSTEEIRAKNT